MTFKRDVNKDTISGFKYLLKILLWRTNENAGEAYDS